MPTRRPDKYTEDTEHARTISRNVDDFLEVERGDANHREFFILLILLITNFLYFTFFYCRMPQKGATGQTARLVIERGDASIISNNTLLIAKLELFCDMRCTHSELFVH